MEFIVAVNILKYYLFLHYFEFKVALIPDSVSYYLMCLKSRYIKPISQVLKYW